MAETRASRDLSSSSVTSRRAREPAAQASVMGVKGWFWARWSRTFVPPKRPSARRRPAASQAAIPPYRSRPPGNNGRGCAPPVRRRPAGPCPCHRAGRRSSPRPRPHTREGRRSCRRPESRRSNRRRHPRRRESPRPRTGDWTRDCPARPHGRRAPGDVVPEQISAKARAVLPADATTSVRPSPANRSRRRGLELLEGAGSHRRSAFGPIAAEDDPQVLETESPSQFLGVKGGGHAGVDHRPTEGSQSPNRNMPAASARTPIRRAEYSPQKGGAVRRVAGQPVGIFGKRFAALEAAENMGSRLEFHGIHFFLSKIPENFI